MEGIWKKNFEMMSREYYTDDIYDGIYWKK